MGIIAVRIRVTGRVQGVFFRAWTREEASRRGIAGWVRNCPDGRVEAHLEGEQTAVDQMVDRMREGPSGARVDDLIFSSVEPCAFDAFEVRH